MKLFSPGERRRGDTLEVCKEGEKDFKNIVRFWL